jgi:hypothetical protein
MVIVDRRSKDPNALLFFAEVSTAVANTSIMLFTTTSRGTATAAAVLVLALVATFSEAKKKSSFPVITRVKPYIACDVCRELVAAAAFWRDEVVANCTTSGRKLTEGEVYEKAVESLCNPLTEGGDWLRRLDWQVDAAATSVTFAARSSFGKCKGKCYTGAEICRDIVDSDDADDFSGLLYSRAKAEKIIKTVCANACKAQRAAAKKAASGRSVLRRDWGAEQFEEIDEKEKEIEEMMERMTLDGKSGPGMDVFSRDEMKELRTAMDTGDFDRVQELDPTFSDMDEADFNMMRHMAAAEDDRAGSGAQVDPVGAEEPAPEPIEAEPAAHQERQPPTTASWWDKVRAWWS